MIKSFPSIFKLTIVLLVINSFVNSALADQTEKVLTVNTMDSAIDLTPFINIYEDATKKLTYEDFSKPAAAQQFKPLNKAANFGFSDSAWWVKLRIVNNNDKAQRVTVRQNYPLIDYVDFHSQQNDSIWLSYSTGDRREFATRPINFMEFLFPVDLPSNAETTIFMRFESSGPMNIGLDLQSEISLFDTVSSNHLITGIYYGGFIILVFYNLLLFIAIKDRTFIYYLLYLASYGLFFAVMNGLAFQYFWPENPWLANQSLIILLSLSLIWSLQFSRSILSIKDISPISNHITSGLIIVNVIPLLISPFVPYRLIIIPMSIITILCTIQLITMGFIAFSRGSKPARYYLVAWSTLLIGIFVYMLKSFGILPHNTWTQNGQQIGSLIEMVLLSLAMSSKVNEYKKGSYMDSLTSLPNRRSFDERFSKEFDNMQNHKEGLLSLLIIDVDNFKQYNDKYGHKQGDEALKFVGKKLQSTARKNTIPNRYGGEEFAVILPNTSAEQAHTIGERIRSKIESDNAQQHNLTVSVGVATYEDNNFASHHQLFEAADQALYYAKENGRNRTECFQITIKDRRATSC
ncbi:diguanylate cyclase [Neptunomonas japonica]|uniref:diguanylate cyclase n=1 Tax=Neptunomonas japonica TaxID=417574 RepID=UPI0003FF5FC5|nr:diguanylate cyclase [Neptunomonas japonica]